MAGRPALSLAVRQTGKEIEREKTRTDQRPKPYFKTIDQQRTNERPRRYAALFS
jgi:hypothetical protein